MPAGRFFSAPYFFSIFHYGLGGRGRALILAALAAAAALAITFFFPRQLRGAAGRLARRKRLWKALAWAALAAAFIFLYFIRPRLEGGRRSTLVSTRSRRGRLQPENLGALGVCLPSRPTARPRGYGLALTSEGEAFLVAGAGLGPALTLFYSGTWLHAPAIW